MSRNRWRPENRMKAAKYLRALGYEDTEIQPVLKKLSIEYKDVSPLVSAALREFGKQ